MAMISGRTVAPLAAMGATWGTRKVMGAVYSRRTGHQPPAADDLEIPMRHAILWAIGTAVVCAVIDVVITRLVTGAFPGEENDFEESTALAGAGLS